MIIKDTIFDTYRICESSHLIYDIDNTIHRNSELSVKIANNDNHIFIELSLNCYNSIEYIYIGNREINLDYYKCCIRVGENSNKIIIGGIIISKYDFNYDDNTVVITFKKKHKYYDKILKIYCLDSHTTYFSVLSLFDNIIENNKIHKKNNKHKSSKLISEMDKLNYLNESVCNEIKNISIKTKNYSSNCMDNTSTISTDSNDSDGDIFCVDSESSDDNNDNIKNKININSDTYKPILIQNNDIYVNTYNDEYSSNESNAIIKSKENKKKLKKKVKQNIPINIGDIDEDLKKKYIERLKKEAMRELSNNSIKNLNGKKKYPKENNVKNIKIIKQKKNIKYNVKMDELATYNNIYKNRYQTKNIDHELNCLLKDIQIKYLEIKKKLISKEISSITPFIEYVNDIIIRFKNNYGDVLGTSLLTIMSYLVI
ncbi:putative orfan [Tupanvirus soda lake]|uniref:Orfan n=2 Tax=Tupanvirus TaxID=2094720 RepID=A0AC62ACR4_9VIRU|nr:putative orfan [Tupanvirus soda lake]QKU35430.1 putative orfan [Tupanvirus soda lake]